MPQNRHFPFLKRVYELSRLDQSKAVNAASIANELGLDEVGLRATAQYLAGEDLLHIETVLHGIPAFVKIRHAGIKAVETGAI